MCRVGVVHLQILTISIQKLFYCHISKNYTFWNAHFLFHDIYSNHHYYKILLRLSYGKICLLSLLSLIIFFLPKKYNFCNYYCSVQKKTTDFKNHVEYKLIKHTIQLKKFQKLFTFLICTDILGCSLSFLIVRF